MNRRLSLWLTAAFAGATIRHLLVLRAISRSRRFLKARTCQASHVEPAVTRPFFYVLLPVLREAPILRQTVDHLHAVMAGHEAQLVVVTTEREVVERHHHLEADDTLYVARQLADEGHCIHLHYADPNGVKADQLNYAAVCISSWISAPAAAQSTFVLCYDADSRPPIDALDSFERAISEHSYASIFHQSSRFELRSGSGLASAELGQRIAKAIAESGVLRANRFVLAYELPRLINRSRLVGKWKRRACACVYSHVTGHGLCIRLSLLQRLPFPAGSPLEDMHYSFILDSRNIAMQPIPNLDVAEVSASLRVQIEQAARWFYGPGRFARYVRDPQVERGPRTWLLGASAMAISGEWLTCAILPTLMAILPWRAPRTLRAAMGVFATVYALQLVAADAIMTPSSRFADRAARLLAYPAGCTLFGVGGLVGALRLLRGATGLGSKTERVRE